MIHWLHTTTGRVTKKEGLDMGITGNAFEQGSKTVAKDLK